MTVRMARMTPPGTAAIATIAVVVDEAWEILAPLFRTQSDATPKDAPPPGSLHFGQFGPPPGDEVVLARRPNTPLPWFEIHCHGGKVVVEWIIEQLTERGANVVPWTELEQLNSGSWIRAAAAEAMTRAPTVTTASDRKSTR